MRAVSERDAQRWTWDTELAAVNAELTHRLLAAYVKVNSRHGAAMEPLHITRPHERDGARQQETVTGDELMTWLGGG